MTGYQMALLHAYDVGAEAIEPWLDWFAHEEEEHDLDTPEGRQREAIDIAVATQFLKVTPAQSVRLHILETRCPDIFTKLFRTRSPGEQLLQIQAAKIRTLGFQKSEERLPTQTLPKKEHSSVSDCQTATIGASE